MTAASNGPTAPWKLTITLARRRPRRLPAVPAVPAVPVPAEPPVPTVIGCGMQVPSSTGLVA